MTFINQSESALFQENSAMYFFMISAPVVAQRRLTRYINYHKA